MQRKSLLTLAFLSGISALIYEICWVRQATLTFGVSIYAYSAVLTAYMGGMAIGGYLIGKRADQTAYPLRLFAWLQVGMAGLGLLAPLVLTGLTVPYAALARHLASRLTVLTVLRLGMSLLVLAGPAVCIGATLPVLSRIYARHSGRVRRDVGGLCAVSTLGSVLGCLLTATAFIGPMGLRETVRLAALTSLIVAGAAWWLTRRRDEAAPSQPGRTRRKRPKDSSQAPAALRFVIWAYALSGFASLGYARWSGHALSPCTPSARYTHIPLCWPCSSAVLEPSVGGHSCHPLACRKQEEVPNFSRPAIRFIPNPLLCPIATAFPRKLGIYEEVRSEHRDGIRHSLDDEQVEVRRRGYGRTGVRTEGYGGQECPTCSGQPLVGVWLGG